MALIRVALTLILAASVSGCVGTSTPGLDSASQLNGAGEETCGRIIGRMQVRILSLRSENKRSQPTSLAKQFESLGSSFGGSKKPEETGTRAARDLADLHASNAKLKSMGCKTYDIEAELAQTDMSVTPRAK